MKNVLLIVVSFFLISSSYAQIAKTASEITPLLKGASIPIINVKSLDNTKVLISDIVKNQKTVLLFYRGGWCPYCNAHLAAIGELKNEIAELGYQIIGVSPDAPEKLKKSIQKNNLDYQLFSDSNTELIQEMGIAFQAPEKYNHKLLKYSDQNNSDVLPVPSVFIVDTNGVIQFQYSNPDYKKRISGEELLTVLKDLE